MTELEKEILNYLQEGIPLVERPFEILARKIGVPEYKFIEIVEKLKREKIIRQISPIYDTKALGYDSSLVAFKISTDIEKAASIINEHPGVSHNYERNDEYNIWFTLAVPPDSKYGLEETVKILANFTGAEDYIILKTVKTFKIGVKLTFNNLNEKIEEDIVKKEKKVTELYRLEKEIIRVTQNDIPLVERPFEEYAKKLGISENSVINKLIKFKEMGVMRRFAAILYHRKAGFKANGMTVWNVPAGIADEIGNFFAKYRSISHCYLRETNGKWKYNLFTMIHGKSREEVEKFVDELSRETGLEDFKILYSTREFKKKRINYFSEDFYKWEGGIEYGEYTGANI
ncbi:siroheme decarboxylase subunit alpha [Persephonella sp.]